MFRTGSWWGPTRLSDGQALYHREQRLSMMSNTVGTLFNIQRFSTEDGPGIRTTVFLKGCPLRCLWCANPESQLPSPQVAHRDSPCIGCFSCIRACPAQAVYQDANGKLRIDRGKCQACGACVRACVAGAMQFYGRTATVGEVFADIKKDIGLLYQVGRRRHLFGRRASYAGGFRRGALRPVPGVGNPYSPGNERLLRTARAYQGFSASRTFSCSISS